MSDNIFGGNFGDNIFQDASEQILDQLSDKLTRKENKEFPEDSKLTFQSGNLYKAEKHIGPQGVRFRQVSL